MSTPTGVRLKDGFSTRIDFELIPTMPFWEIQVTPPGFEGGDPIRTTTMRNLVWETFQPRQLKEMTPMSFRAAYDPAVLDSANTIINKVQKITVTHSNGATWIFYGWLRRFVPDRVQMHAQPEAECEIICGNENTSGVEVNPTRTPATTTTSTTTTTTTTT